MNYQIKGNFNYHLEVSCPQLNETTNITINAFSSKINQIPIGCKFQWFKIFDTERIKIESQGNIYPCSIFDIGYKIEVIVQSFETGLEGQATVEFQKIQISTLLEQKLSQLYHNNMKQLITANDQNWIFTLENLENSSTKQKFNYADQCVLPLQQQVQVQFDNQTLKFRTKEDKDSFCALFISMQSLRRIHLKFIAYNIGKLNQKQVNFQNLLNSQLPQILNEKSTLPIKKTELIQSMATSSDLRAISQSQHSTNQFKQEIAQLLVDKQKMSSQIEKLSRENKDLQTNSKTNSASKDQLESLDRLIQSLKNELFQLKSRETDLMNQNARLTMALNEKQEKSLSQSQFFDDIKLKQYQDLLQESNKEKQKLQDELNKYARLGQSRGNQNSLFDSEKERLLQVNQKLMQEIQNYTSQIKELQVELEMLKNMSRISMSMSMVEDPVLKTKVEQLEQENRYLQKKISILEEELQKRKQVKPQKQQPEKEQQIQQLTETNKRYLEENLKLFEEIRQLREKFDFPSSINSSMRDSKIQDIIFSQQLEQQIERMKQTHNLEISKMKQKIEKLITELQEASQGKKQVDQLVKQNKRLVEENTHLADQIKNLADLNISQSMSDSIYGSKIFNCEQYKEISEQLYSAQRKNQELQSKLDFQLQRDSIQVEKIKQFEIETTKLKSQLREFQLSNSDNREIKLLQSQIDEYQRAKDNLMRENLKLGEDILSLKQDQDYLNNKIKQADNQAYDLKQKQMQLQEENRTLKLFPQSAEKQINLQLAQLQQQNKNLTEEIMRLQSQANMFKDLSQSNISVNESVLGSKVYEAKEYKILESEKQQILSENEKLQLEIKDLSLKQSSLVALQQENLKLREEIQSLQGESRTLKDQIQSNNQQLQNQIISLQSENNKLSAQVQRLESKNSSLNGNDSKFDQEVGGNQSVIQKSSNALTLSATNRLETENKQLQQQITEMKRLKSQVSDLVFENNKLSKEMQFIKLTQTGNQTQSQFDSKLHSQDPELVIQISQLKAQLNEKSHQIKTLQMNCQQNMEELQQVHQRFGEANKSHEDITAKYEILFKQITQLQEANREKESSIIQLSEIVESLQTKLDDQEAQNNELIAQVNQLQQMRQENLNLQTQNQSLSSKNIQLQQSLIAQQEQVMTLQNQVELSQNQIRSTQRFNSQKINNDEEQNLLSVRKSEENYSQHSSRILNLNTQDYQLIAQQTKQINQLKQQNSELLTAINKLNEELREYQERSFSVDRSDYSNRYQSSGNQKLTQNIQLFASTKDNEYNESGALNSQLYESKLRCESMEQTIKSQLNEISQLQTMLKNMEKQQIEFEKCKKDFDFYRGQYQILQQDIDNLKQQQFRTFQENNQTLSKKTQEIQQLNQDIKDNQQQIVTLKFNLQQRDEEFAKQGTTKKLLEEDIKKLNELNKSLNLSKQEYQKANEESRALKSNYDKLQSENVNLNKQLKLQEDQLVQITALSQALELLQNQKDEYQFQLHQLKQETKDFQYLLSQKEILLKESLQKCSYLSSELDKEQDKCENSKKRLVDINSTLQKKDSEIINFNNKIKSLDEQLSKKDLTIANLNSEINQGNQEKQQQCDQLEQIPKLLIQNETLRKENLQHQDNLNIIQQQLTMMENQINNLNREKSPVRSKNSSIVKATDSLLNEKLSQLESKIEQQNIYIESLLEQIKVEKRQNNNLISLINKLNDDLREQQEKSFSIDRSSETYLINRSFNSKFITEGDVPLQNQYQSVDLYESDRKRQSQYGHYDFLELQNENKQLRIEIEQLKSELEQLKSQSQQLPVVSNCEHQQQINQLNFDLEKLQSDNLHLKQQVRESQNSGSKNILQQQVNQLEEEVMKKQGLEQSNQRLNNEIKLQITKSVELQQQLEEQEGRNEELFKHVQELEEIILDLQKNNQPNLEVKNSLENSINQSQQEEIETLKIKISDLNDKIELLENEIQKSSLKISVKDSQINQNNRKNKKLEDQISNLQEQLSQFSGIGSIVTQDKNDELKSLKGELEALKLENQKLLTQLKSYQEFDEQINSKIKQLEEQIDRLTKSNSALIEENYRLNQQLKDVANLSYSSNGSQNH